MYHDLSAGPMAGANMKLVAVDTWYNKRPNDFTICFRKLFCKVGRRMQKGRIMRSP